MDSKYNIVSSVKSTENNSVKRLKPIPIVLSSSKKVKLNDQNVSQKKPNHHHFQQNGQNNGKNKHVNAPSILEQRQALPIFAARHKLLNHIKQNDTVIILGETGSGKTTQVPQFIHSFRLEANAKIAITQPRRVAAISIAQRVSTEIGQTVGELVGYTVRFEDCSSSLTKIKYLTDGMLLREAMADNLLMKYNVIILDEAHERTVHTDILFGIVKTAQKIRNLKCVAKLKIVIMSATMDVDHFSKYFNNAVVLYIEGRTFSVSINYTLRSYEDYTYAALITIFQIHKEKPTNEDILVFLTGQEEIESLAHSIRTIAKDPEIIHLPVRVYPLYAGLPSNQQLDAFKPLSKGMRKIILSTNVAETSLTISGIKHVIDTGVVKARTYHPGTGFDILKVQKISQEQAWQRAGRAGRESDGFCYRMFTKSEFNSFRKTSVPEIQRSNLSTVILQLLSLKLDVLNFDFMDKPPQEALLSALQQLHQLGAITNLDEPKLTDLGKKMALFPLSPQYSKILISSPTYGCTEEMITIIALLSTDSIFYNPITKREEALAARQKFMSNLGDHIMLLNAFRAFDNSSDPKKFCKENFMNMRNLNYAKNVRNQLIELCERCDIPMSSCGKNTEPIRKCLIVGLYTNIAELYSKQYIAVDTKKKVTVHPSSTLQGSYPSCIIFSEIVVTGKCYVKTCSVINAEWVQEIVPEYLRTHRMIMWSHNNS